MKSRKKGVPARFFRRVLAYALDALVVFLVIGLPLGYTYKKVDDSKFKFLSSKDYNFKDLIIGSAIGILTVLYWAIFEYKLRQSPGKMLTKIYVNPTNKELTFAHAIIRNLTKISLFLLIIDCLYMVFKKTHLRYAETIAHTEVLRDE